jgi:hypothetical protein
MDIYEYDFTYYDEQGRTDFRVQGIVFAASPVEALMKINQRYAVRNTIFVRINKLHYLDGDNGVYDFADCFHDFHVEVMNIDK